MDPLSWLSSSGLYTRFLTADQSTQSMVFKNIQILSKSFWWIGECCAENSNIFISTSAPWVGTGQLLSQPGSALHIGKRMLMDGRNLRVCLLAAAGLRWVEARGAAGQQSAPRPVKRYQKSADGARAVCRLVQAASWWIPNHRKHLDPFLVRPQPQPTPHTPSQSIHCQSEPFPSQITFHQPGPARSRGGDQQTIAGRREMMKWKR